MVNKRENQGLPMKPESIIFFLLLIICSRSTAQLLNAGTHSEDGNLYDGQKPLIIQDSIILRHFQLYQKERLLPGYRIQIISTTNRNDLKKAKAEFLKNFPTLKIYEVYQQPYFKLRVGDYLYAHEAFYVKKIIEKIFPGAYVVPESKIANEDFPLPSMEEEKNKQ